MDHQLLIRYLRADPERIFDLSPWDLEGVVGEVLASMGWEINGPTSRDVDSGVDLLAISRDAAGFETTWAIEVRLYAPQHKINQATIYETYAAAHHLGLERTMLVTTSSLTPAAADKAEDLGIFVADLDVLVDWLSRYKETAGSPHIATKQFRSCFVSHSHEDHSFATRLVRRLRADGVRVWFAPEDLRPGQKINEEVGKAIETFDRLILVLSHESMSSRWVQSEVRRAYQREIEERTRVLFPLSLVPFDVIRSWELFDSDLGLDLAAAVREYFIPDFSNWEDDSRFEDQAKALLQGLQAL